jgi:hypothetical protein
MSFFIFIQFFSNNKRSSCLLNDLRSACNFELYYFLYRSYLSHYKNITIIILNTVEYGQIKQLNLTSKTQLRFAKSNRSHQFSSSASYRTFKN